MKSRTLTEADRPLLEKWWKQWGFNNGITKELLPKTGDIVEKDNIPIVSIFMYETNSGVAALGWVLSEKDYREEDREDALRLLINTAEKDWKQKGGKYLFHWGNNKKFNINLEKIGFTEGDSNYSHLIKKI